MRAEPGMELTFLSGAISMTKTIVRNPSNGVLNTSSYPLIKRVTSTTRAANSMDEFATALVEQGAQGHCLLKGSLDTPLMDESRAGHTLDTDHYWVVLDFDGVDCPPTFEGAVEAIEKYLPAECHGVDCIIQLSSSAHRPDTRKLSAHVFMLLERPASTKQLTEWFVWVNFNGALRQELRLTDSCMALHFPLDRTVASPAKLIYIAPPKCVGFDSPLDESVQIYDGTRRTLSLREFAPVAPSVVSDKVNELRAAAGMPERQYKTRIANGYEVMVEAEEAVVHDMKTSGDGFLRFNMNGGDSMAYFINVRKPGLIGNFKGEPYMQTQQVAPDLYKKLVKTSKQMPAELPPASVEPLAFYATNRQSTIYIGSYDRANDDLRVEPSTQGAAFSWLMAHGAMPSTLPHYDLVHDMTSDTRFEDGYPIINLYKRTEYIKKYANAERRMKCAATSLNNFKKFAPVLWKVIYSAVGDSDKAALYFINWLAAIFQRRDRTMSAWVLHGVQGTGKGFVVNYILRPLVGDTAVTQQLYSTLNTDFNAYIEGKLFVVFNEVELSRSLDWSAIRSKLYDWITEPTVSVTAKGKDPRDVTNYGNYVLCSNSTRPIVIEDGDRRFNVAEFQNERLFVTANEFATVSEGRELEPFARMLGEWQVNDEMLIKPYSGEAKERVYDATHNLIDAIARAIREGDGAFFVDNRPDATQLRTDFSGKVLPMKEYDELLQAMQGNALNVLRPTDLYVLFRVVAISDKSFPENRAKQRRIYARYGLDGGVAVKDRRTGKTSRGVPGPEWRMSQDAKAAIEELSEPSAHNVIPIKGDKA